MLASFSILGISPFSLHCLINQILEGVEVYEVQIMLDLGVKPFAEQFLLFEVSGYFLGCLASEAVETTLIVADSTAILPQVEKLLSFLLH